jgi:hypothetical protein
MSKLEINPGDMFESLRLNIMEYDSLRPPISWGLFPLPINSTFEILMNGKKRDIFKKDIIFYKEISKYINSYRYDFEVSKSDRIYIFVTLILSMTFVVVTSLLTIVYFSLTTLQGILFTAIIGFPTFYIFLVGVIKRRLMTSGKKHDTDLKKVVQMLIDYGVELLSENNLDPHDFPIKIKHNDYDFLNYEKQENNSYLGYLRNESK